MQLEEIKSHGDLTTSHEDAGFKPLQHMATDFIWKANYGYRAAIASPECDVDLAELFVAWGFNGINDIAPQTGHSPLSAAVTSEVTTQESRSLFSGFWKTVGTCESRTQKGTVRSPSLKNVA